jgi:hypothetical protein
MLARWSDAELIPHINVQAAGHVPTIRDRAQVALANADIRKRKAALLADVANLKTLVKQGKVTKEQALERQQRVRFCRLVFSWSSGLIMGWSACCRWPHARLQ